ncbi:MAG: hypothetical protein GPJ54_15165 [Candidatus Heimdallarchaeota archaeon]|nr:hypothetical protein [Candidatus Heimdallarchaeota archaeon]
MLSPSIATLSTYLLDSSAVGLNPFTPPLISNPDKIDSEIVNPWVNLSYSPDWIYPVVDKFGTVHTSTLLFSFLSGDNILIVHPDQEVRLRFLGFFLNLIPSIALKYNRITFGCSELDGNENIVGIDQLPHKYRSHKKLYLPLDTIFVDLTNHSIEGDGIKRSPLTDKLSELINSSYSSVKEELHSFYAEIIDKTQRPTFEENEKDVHLKDRIQIKLKLKSETKQQDWLMF